MCPRSGFVPSFLFLCPRSGSRYRRSIFCTLVPVLGVQGTSAKTTLLETTLSCETPATSYDGSQTPCLPIPKHTVSWNLNCSVCAARCAWQTCSVSWLRMLQRPSEATWAQNSWGPIGCLRVFLATMDLKPLTCQRLLPEIPPPPCPKIPRETPFQNWTRF